MAMKDGEGEDYQWAMTIYSPVCFECAHFDIMASKLSTDDRKCPAFPEGIPREIWLGKNLHMRPYPGDHGIQFEQR